MLDLLFKRRSTRKYRDEKISADVLERIIKSMLLYPSSRGIKPLEFFVIDDRDILASLSESKRGAGFLKGASCAIAVCADPEKSDVWIEDASIAAAIILLSAEHEGLGACWIQIRNRSHDETETAEDYVRKILKIEKKLSVECIISLGYPDEKSSPYSEDNLEYDRVCRDFYKK
jgi:nitroreductase